MSSLYIAEYSGVGQNPQQTEQAAITPALAVQKVTFTGTAGVSTAFGASTRLVRITADGIASIRFAFVNTDLATISYPRMAADTVEYFAVSPGMFVSAITNT